MDRTPSPEDRWSVRELWRNPEARLHLMMAGIMVIVVSVMVMTVPVSRIVEGITLFGGLSAGMGLMSAAWVAKWDFVIARVVREAVRRVYADLLSGR